MKPILLSLLIILMINVRAQDSKELIKNFRLDFAIPDHPAFSILDKNPDNLLKPSNTQELFSIIYSEFLKNNSFLIPRDFSLEFSPAQLIGINKITFDDYMNSSSKRILYDIKTSIATKTNEDDSLQNIALGLRITWIDETSLFFNKNFIKEAYSQMYKSLNSEVKFQDSLFKLESFRKEFKIAEDMSVSDALATDPGLIDKIRVLYNNEQQKHPDYEFFNYEELRKKYRNLNWNKLKFETAFAIKYKSADSLYSHSRYSKFQIYNTLAFPLGNGKDDSKAGWGQGLLGINFADERFDSLRLTTIDTTLVTDTITYHESNLTIAARLYAGTNAFKTFLETSYKMEFDRQKKFSLNLGSEINITDGLWAVVNIGNEWTKSLDERILNRRWAGDWFFKLDLRFHLPEKKKI